jgi:glycosyltransferase involved in cell wall biosynthesis
VDAYHVSCEKTIKNFPNSIDKQKIHIMPYWYNEKIWRPVSEKHTLRQKFSIPENKFVIGSFQRDTEGSDLKTPKLSKGPDIFCDIVERLDPKPHILLSGWRRQYVISRLTNADITYSYFELVDVNTLNELYNCLDLYLVTSRYEGGPQAVIECASNKTPILSTDVGIANQALIEKCILNDTIDFINNIKSDNFDYSEENYKKIQQFKMGTLFPQYLTFFKSI